MRFFGLKERSSKPAKAPVDECDALVTELDAAYPFKDERFGARSMIRLIIWTVMELKKRGRI